MFNVQSFWIYVRIENWIFNLWSIYFIFVYWHTVYDLLICWQGNWSLHWLHQHLHIIWTFGFTLNPSSNLELRVVSTCYISFFEGCQVINELALRPAGSFVFCTRIINSSLWDMWLSGSFVLMWLVVIHCTENSNERFSFKEFKIINRTTYKLTFDVENFKLIFTEGKRPNQEGHISKWSTNHFDATTIMVIINHLILFLCVSYFVVMWSAPLLFTIFTSHVLFETHPHRTFSKQNLKFEISN